MTTVKETTYTLLPLERVALTQLKAHPRNYRNHPADEIEHLKESITSNGVYRNVVISQDGYILAGHGVVEAARQLLLESIPAYRVSYKHDDPRAIKLLVSDNEISHLAESDDRALTELLRELKELDSVGLLGTGYDEMMLANLLYVTRPASEIHDLDAAAQWVGLPEYDIEGGGRQFQLVVHFVTVEDRLEFYRRLNLDTGDIEVRKSLWWPKRILDDSRAIRFTDRQEEEEEAGV